MFPALDRLLADDVRLILLDLVPAEHITALEIAERKHRKRFVHISPADESLQRKALAGADFSRPGTNGARSDLAKTRYAFWSHSARGAMPGTISICS